MENAVDIIIPMELKIAYLICLALYLMLFLGAYLLFQYYNLIKLRERNLFPLFLDYEIGSANNSQEIKRVFCWAYLHQIRKFNDLSNDILYFEGYASKGETLKIRYGKIRFVKQAKITPLLLLFRVFPIRDDIL